MKFAETLSAQLTPEWRSQYLKYNKLKELLSEAKDNAPSGEDDLAEMQRHFMNFEETFFNICIKEQEKINLFFREKINEAIRKFAKLKSDFANFKKVQHASKTSRFTTKKKFHSVHDFRLAFSEYYLSLILIQNYQELNYTGFRKILKKHDKVLTTSKGMEWFNANILHCEFSSNKSVNSLISEVEELVTSELEGGDHKTAMKRLRVPPLGQPRYSGLLLSRIGFFFGVSVMFLVIITTSSIILTESRNGTTPETSGPVINPSTMAVAVRLFRGFILLSLMVMLLGVNVYGWRNSGVNHVLIFELDPRNHLSSFEIIELGLVFLTISLGGFCFWIMEHVFWDTDELTKLDDRLRYIPLGVLVIPLIFLFNPAPVLLASSRKWLLRTIVRVIFAPFCAVKFPDFWLADQFNSIVPIFADFGFIVCFYIQGAEFDKIADGECGDRTSMLTMRAIMSCLPAWFRFAQCFRRAFDSRKWNPHLLNAGKYSTTFFVVIFRTLHAATFYPDVNDVQNNAAENVTLATTTPVDSASHFQSWYWYGWIVSAVISALYAYVWDVKVDWGLCEKGNFPLREQIVYRFKAYYYIVICLDLVLRFMWTVQVSGTSLFDDNNPVGDVFFTTGLSFLEMFRRFMWNFFRLENEHLNNVGEFRAVRDISIKPLLVDDVSILEEMMDGPDGVNSVRERLGLLSPRRGLLLSYSGRGKDATLSKHATQQITRALHEIRSMFNLRRGSRNVVAEDLCCPTTDEENIALVQRLSDKSV